MSHAMVLVIYGFLLAIQSVAYAMQNVTVEDSDPSIQYSGEWNRDESVTSTEDPLATATLKFTGEPLMSITFDNFLIKLQVLRSILSLHLETNSRHI